MEVLIFVVIFVVVIGISFWSKHRQRTNWKTLAQEFGLQYVDGGWFGEPSMYGGYRGAKLNVQTEVQGTGKHKKVYTVVEVALSALTPIGLEVYREGFFQKVGKVLGGEDIQVGDAELDKTFIVRGTDRQKIRDLLTNPAVKGRLLSAQNKYSTFRIESGAVRVRENGRTANMDKLRGYVRTVVAAANTIEEACMAKPNPTPHPKQLDAELQVGKQPARQPAGASTVPFGRPAPSGSAADTPQRTPDAAPEAASPGDDDWW